MKLIPFRCEFGHITIREFRDRESKPSVTICERCKKESVAKIIAYEHPYYDKKYIHTWPSKQLKQRYEPEMAVKI